MLAGRKPDMSISEKWKKLETYAFELVKEFSEELL